MLNWLAQKRKSSKASDAAITCSDIVATATLINISANHTEGTTPGTADTPKPNQAPCTDKPGDAPAAQSPVPGDNATRQRRRPEAVTAKEKLHRTSKLVVDATISEHQPDLISLTEDKQKHQCTANKAILAAVGRMAYQAQLSCSKPADGGKRGRSEVAVLVN